MAKGKKSNKAWKWIIKGPRIKTESDTTQLNFDIYKI